MTEVKDALRSTIQHLIKDNTDAAKVDLHPVITAKMQELAGTKKAAPAEVNDDDDADIDDTED